MTPEEIAAATSAGQQLVQMPGGHSDLITTTASTTTQTSVQSQVMCGSDSATALDHGALVSPHVIHEQQPAQMVEDNAAAVAAAAANGGANIINACINGDTVTLTDLPGGGSKTIIIQNFENLTPESQREILQTILSQDSNNAAMAASLGPQPPAAVKAVLSPVKTEPITSTANVQVEAAPMLPPVTVQEFTHQNQD